MSFRNLFQKDIDKNRTPSSFSFNQTKSKIADQQQQKNPFDTNQLNDNSNNNNNTIFNSNEDDNNIFYSFNNKELESREDEYQHDNDNDTGEYGDDIEEEEEADVEIEEEENIENPGDNTSILNEDERRRRNIEASIRFRVRRKNKIIQLENQIISENNKIEEFKIDLHKLEIENVCLRKMLLGNWNPQDDNISDNNFSNDSNLLSSAINNSKSNFEILQLLKQTKKHL